MTHDELIEKGYRQYRGKDIDVYFSKHVCIHAGVCTQTIPKVFNVKRKPWVLPDEDPAEKVAEMIKTCPSGALQYIIKPKE